MENNISHQNLHKYMPSKKIRIIIGVIIVVAILFALRNPIINLKNKIFNRQSLITTTTNPEIDQPQTTLSIDEDTDGDGLLDWQETLLGTDPRIPNSKTDVPDSIREVVNLSKDSVTVEDKLALKVYQRLLTEPKGNDITEALQAATSKEMLDYADSLDRQLTSYSIDDLNLVDNTSETEASYGSAVMAALKPIRITPEKLAQINANLLSTDLTTPDIGFQKNLSGTLANLLKMPVPLRYSDTHLLIINSVTHMDRILSAPQTTTDASTQYARFLVFQKNRNLLVQTVATLAAMLKL
jgi:hypothetical protein